LELSKRHKTKKLEKKRPSKLYTSRRINRDQLEEGDEISLKNEIDIMMQIDHPNVVKLFEVYEDDKSYNLIMELMTGGEVP
jgi:serine/threonine protein kinase